MQCYRFITFLFSSFFLILLSFIEISTFVNNTNSAGVL